MDTKWKPGTGGRNVATDWTGFDKAVAKEEAKHPKKPSIFWSEGYTGEARQNFLRRQMLWSVIRCYHSTGDLAMEILSLLSQGPVEELEAFVASVRHRKSMIVFLQPYPPGDVPPEGGTPAGLRGNASSS